LTAVSIESVERHDRVRIDLEARARHPSRARWATVHHELAETCSGARVTGPSAKFDAQRVGRDHALAGDDIVELLT
jgi:hypothetical protein